MEQPRRLERELIVLENMRMNRVKRNVEKEMPLIDEAWWASVLAEEGRYSGRESAGAAADKSTVGKEAKQVGVGNPLVDWSQVKDIYMQDRIIELKVSGFNRGGLLVEGGGLQGFVPVSHLVDLSEAQDKKQREFELSRYAGRTLRLKVIECAPEDGRIVFSERAAQAESGKRAELFHSLQTGQNVCGVVTNVTDFGAFVDLGGVEGLVHISEMSWGRVAHPAQCVKVGESINVQVLEIAPERCRVALSLKRIQPNPWETAEQIYPPGTITNAKVTSVLSFGAFARLDSGIEGLIHASEIPNAETMPVKSLLVEGSRVSVRILHLDAKHHRLGLSMKVD